MKFIYTYLQIIFFITSLFFSIVFPAYSQPVNDNVNDNITWQGIGGLPSFAGNNIGATKEVNEPNHAGNIGGSSVWYGYDGHMPGRQAITTNGSGFDTIISLYYLDAGNFTNPSIDFTPLVTVASNDDVGVGQQTSRIEFDRLVWWGPDVSSFGNAQALLYLVIDGKNGATGNFLLSTESLPPNNDNFFDATVINASQVVSIYGYNYNATVEFGEPNDGGGNNTVWYKWTAPFGGLLTLDTYEEPILSTFASTKSRMDTILSVYVGSDVTNLSLIERNDNDTQRGDGNDSRIDINVIGGQTYYFSIDGPTGDGASGIKNGDLTYPAIIAKNNEGEFKLNVRIDNQFTADLEVVSVETGNYVSNRKLTYTIKNNGFSNVFDAQVIFTLGPKIKITSAGTCTISGMSLICPVGGIDAGITKTMETSFSIITTEAGAEAVDLEIFSNSITDSYSANNVKTFNLDIVKSTQVPMFGFWDQSALTLLLSVFGVVALRKHSIKIFKQ